MKKFKFPGIKILDLYIMRKFLGTYLFTIGLLIVIVVIFDAVEKIDDFIELKAPLSSIALDYYVNFIPFFINQFSGLITFIAVIFFTSKMAYNTEIIAILSSGTSFNRLLWPYFLSSLAIASLSLFLNLWVIPAANIKRIDFEGQFLKSHLATNYEPHIYRQLEPGTFVYIRDYSGVRKRASFLAIETYQGSTLTASLEASDVTFDPETKRWSAPKHITRTFENGTETFVRRQKLDTLINLDATELGKVEELVKTMGIRTLDRFIAQQRDKGSDMIDIFEVERHKRYAYPFATFILTLIGVSLSSRKVRGGTGLHIGIGIALCSSYILFSRFAEEFAKNGVLPTMLAVWLPNILYAVIAVYLYRKAPK